MCVFMYGFCLSEVMLIMFEHKLITFLYGFMPSLSKCRLSFLSLMATYFKKREMANQFPTLDCYAKKKEKGSSHQREILLTTRLFVARIPFSSYLLQSISLKWKYIWKTSQSSIHGNEKRNSHKSLFVGGTALYTFLLIKHYLASTRQTRHRTRPGSRSKSW